MKHLFIFILLLASGTITAQSFPNARKQPKQKEMHKQHQKFKRQGKRRHHKMRTAGSSRSLLPTYMQYYPMAAILPREEFLG